MKRKFASILVIAIALLVGLSGCTSVTVNGGEEAVLIKKPWIFGSGGVDSDAIQAGQTWAAITTDYIKFPNTPITITEAFHDLISADGTPVSFDASLQVTMPKGNGPKLYQGFGVGWYDNNVKQTFLAAVRDEANKYKMAQLANGRAVLPEIENIVHQQMVALFQKINLPMTADKVIMGKVTPPPAVLIETQNTAAQNQNVLTQQAKAKAEEYRKLAEQNRAAADVSYRERFGMSTEQYLHLRQIEVNKEIADLLKDGKVPNLTLIVSPQSVPITRSIQ